MYTVMTLDVARCKTTHCLRIILNNVWLFCSHFLKYGISSCRYISGCRIYFNNIPSSIHNMTGVAFIVVYWLLLAMLLVNVNVHNRDICVSLPHSSVPTLRLHLCTLLGVMTESVKSGHSSELYLDKVFTHVTSRVNINPI